MVRRTFALLGVWTLIWSAAAITLSPNDEAVRQAALQWLLVVDAGKYGDAALMMSEEVRALQTWSKYLTTHRAPLGRMNKRRTAEVKHASTIHGLSDIRNYVIIRFKTSFEHPPLLRARHGTSQSDWRTGLAPNSVVTSKPVVIEEVVMAKIGCCWEVAGYEIRDQ